MGHTIVPVQRDEVIVTVPDEVKQELEEFCTYLAENPGQVGLVTFDTPDELTSWNQQARSYLSTREAGELVFRKLRTDALDKDTQLRFSIKTPEQVATEKAVRVAAATKKGTK